MGDPQGKGPVTVELNYSAAELLSRLCVELETDDARAVMSRALGILDLCLHTQRQGGRLCLVNPQGEIADVVF